MAACRRMYILILTLVSLRAFWGGEVRGQTTIFSENIGTPAVTTAITSWAGWQNNGILTFTGSGDVRNTAVSSGYTVASGGGNVFLTNTIGTNFQISNINTSAYSSLSLSFGVYKSTTASSGSDLIVEVSPDGITYTALTFSALPSGTGTAAWYYRTASGSIPSASNLRIRFRQTATATQYRIDDIFLQDNSCSTPTSLSTSLSATPSSISAALNWSSGYGSNRIVIFNIDNSFTDPIDGSTPGTANTIYSGSGEQVVYNSSGNSVTVTGLSPSTTYYYRIYEYNCSGVTSKYLPGGTSGQFTTTSSNNVEVIGSTSGTDLYYSTLKLAFDAINNGTHKGVITVNILANTNETGGTAILNASVGTASYTSVNIQPSGGAARTITGNIAGPLVEFYGANKVTIDGRLGGTGSTKSLTLTNTSTSAFASTIQLTYDASYNEIKYCTILGSNRSTSLPYGTIDIFGGSTTGMDNNNINNNDIGDATGGLPSFAVYSYSNTSSCSNDNNTIDNNNIYNYFHPAYEVYGLFLKAGIGITGNSGWTISNNRFYQTALLTATSGNLYNAIRIGASATAVSGGGHTITGNVIGYSNSSGTGTTTYGPNAPNNACKFVAIEVFQNGVTSNVDGNIIGGISLNTTSGASTAPGIFSAISVEAGSVTIGTITGNTIGATSGTASISIKSSSTSGPAIIPIYVSSSMDCQVQNNTIGAIATGGSASIGYEFEGIYIEGSGSHTVTSNTIGNTTANNIAIGAIGTTTAATNVIGIYTAASGTTVTIGNTSGTGNTIQNISSLGSDTKSYFIGIWNDGAAGTFNANYNTFAANTLAGGGYTSIPGTSYVYYAALLNNAVVKNIINMNYNTVSTAVISKNAYAGLTSFISNYSGASTATLNINNNIFNGCSFTGTAATGEFDAIYNEAGLGTININNNNFNNLSIKSTGKFYFCFNSSTTKTTNYNNNFITTAFHLTTGGGSVYLFSNMGSPTGGTATINANNFSNIFLEGASLFNGILHNTSNSQVVIITNNTISSVTGGTGILYGIDAEYAKSGSSINGNTISVFSGSNSICGIMVGLVNRPESINIFGNTINSFTENDGTAPVYGIYFGYGSAITIYKNKIYDLNLNKTSSYINGIKIGGFTTPNINVTIYNNIIGDLKAPATSNIDAIRGISITSASLTSNINVYYNTIYINALSTGTGVTDFGTTGIYHTASNVASTALLDLRNNIVVNSSTPKGAGTTAAFRRSSGAAGTLANYASTSNNNLFYSGTPGAANLIYSDGTSSAQTLADYKAGVYTAGTIAPRDAASISEMPQFKSIIGSDATYLHIKDDCTLTATGIESGGTVIGAPYDIDYDAEMRFGNASYTGGGSAPDIGADEFDKKALEVTATLGTVGPTNYSTLQAAFKAINKGTHKGDITIKVSCSTVETASAVLYASGYLDLSSYASINIYPTVTGASISASHNAPLIDLDGANNVTVDGRVGKTGTTPDLVIRHTGTDNSSINVRYIHSANTNTLKYCNIQGACPSSVAGVIFFSTSASGNGNDNNIIDNCFLTNSGVRPNNIIASNGSSTTYDNSNNTISNNTIFNNINYTSASNSNGIYLTDFTSGWLISGNSFYETTSLIPTTNSDYSAIRISNSSGDNFTISNNYIGGTAVSCGGAAFTKTNSNNNAFYGILFNVSSSLSSAIQGNTIKNFAWSNSDNANWTGIEVDNGTCSVSGNTIGASTGTASVSLTNGSTTATAYLVGIRASGTGAVTIQNNNIGAINALASASRPTDLYGIYKSGNYSSIISGNLIGSLLDAGSLNTDVGVVASNMYGIYTINSGSVSIIGNTVANVSNSHTGTGTGTIVGIYAGSSGTNTVAKNFIRGFSTTNAYHKLYGINSPTGTGTFSNNIISLGTGITTGCNIYGLYDNSTSPASIYYNTIYTDGNASVGANETFAYYNGNTTSRFLLNNILYAHRTGTGSHYAIRLPNNGLTIDYNDYFPTDAFGNFNNAPVSTFALWRTATGQDNNSVNNGPNFPGGLLATNYKPNIPVDLYGVDLTSYGISDDYGGNVRHIGPTMGAWELNCQCPGEWTGAVSKNWSIPGNWCGNAVPTAGMDVVIQNVTNKPEVDITGAVCYNLTINIPASLQINSGQALNVNGNLNNKGTFTINSSALNQNGSLIVEGSGKGNIMYNRYLENNNRWFITSSPLNNSFNLNGSTIGIVDGTYNFGPYDETNNTGWIYASTMPSILSIGKGYVIKLASGNSVQYSGSLNGDLSIDLPSTGVSDGWNAVGNPYTSAIRIKDETGYSGFITQNSSSLDPEYQAIYLWNQTGPYTAGIDQYYKVICSAGYIAGGGYTYAGALSETYVQPGQGFLVNIKYNNGSTSPVVFKKGTSEPGMQIHNNSSLLKSTETSWPGITLLASNNGRTCSTIVAFNENMTNGLDPSYDAGLLSASDFNVYTHLASSDNETDFTIQSLPDNQYDSLAVPIGLDLPEAGEVTFKAVGVILPNGVYPVIEDRLLQLSFPLKTETDSLTVLINKPTWGIGRFYLHFGESSKMVSIYTQPKAKKLSALYTSQKITLFGTPEQGSYASLYDINGRKLGGEHLLNSANQNEIPATGLADGIYLLNIKGKTTNQTLKITVLNR